MNIPVLLQSVPRQRSFKRLVLIAVLAVAFGGPSPYAKDAPKAQPASHKAVAASVLAKAFVSKPAPEVQPASHKAVAASVPAKAFVSKPAAKAQPASHKAKAASVPAKAFVSKPAAKKNVPASKSALKPTIKPAAPKTPAHEVEEITFYVGKPMKEILLRPIAGGKPVSTRALKGKPYILDFWATWCPASRMSFPYLERLQELGAAQGLEVYCLSDEPQSAILKFLEQYPYRLGFALDPGETIAKQFKVEYLPTTIAVDSSGVIRQIDAAFCGPDGLEKLSAAIGVEVDLPENLAPHPLKAY